jgi:hypothetical protein
MKKLCFLCLFFIAVKTAGFAQTLYAPGATLGSSINSNVGIGLHSPGRKLQVIDGISMKSSLGINNAGEPALMLSRYSGAGTTYQSSIISTKWNGNSYGMSFETTGPSYHNDNDLSSASTKMYITQQGYVGIGTINPSTKLTVVGNDTGSETITLDNTSSSNLRITLVRYGSAGGGDYWTGLNSANTGSLGADGLFVFRSTGGLVFSGSYQAEHMRVNTLGNVLIGKTTQVNTAYKLDVNGGVRANSIVVNTTGADFVFAKNYRLRPLSEVESFIQANHHLPEIAPAAQMQAEGVSVGELQTQLLQKIEELTLYLIEQNKKIDAQNQKIEVLEKQLSETRK